MSSLTKHSFAVLIHVLFVAKCLRRHCLNSFPPDALLNSIPDGYKERKNEKTPCTGRPFLALQAVSSMKWDWLYHAAENCAKYDSLPTALPPLWKTTLLPVKRSRCRLVRLLLKMQFVTSFLVWGSAMQKRNCSRYLGCWVMLGLFTASLESPTA